MGERQKTRADDKSFRDTALKILRNPEKARWSEFGARKAEARETVRGMIRVARRQPPREAH